MPLVLNPEGKRLSKRDGAVTLRQLLSHTSGMPDYLFAVLGSAVTGQDLVDAVEHEEAALGFNGLHLQSSQIAAHEQRLKALQAHALNHLGVHPGRLVLGQAHQGGDVVEGGAGLGQAA